MPPDTRRGRPVSKGAPDKNRTAGSGDIRSIGDVPLRCPSNAPRWRRQIGCPCGCKTRRPWLVDPDCIRFRPLGPVIEYDGHDVADLGLVPHPRDNCEACRAVGA